jgi:hypothetical protein
MRAWEKHLIQPAFYACFAAWMGALERKLPGFPAKPDHGAPFVHYRVLFGHEHANFSIQTTASSNASSGEPANALGSDFTHEIGHIQERPAETIDPRNEKLTSPERCN